MKGQFDISEVKLIRTHNEEKDQDLYEYIQKYKDEIPKILVSWKLENKLESPEQIKLFIHEYLLILTLINQPAC
jgi:hypothetical protein